MVFDKVKEIIAEQLDVDVEVINEETSLMKDLKADSLDAVEIMMALEDEFEIEVPDDVAEGFKNIGDIVKYVESKIA
ncbi:MAG: acyl carrier protein [Tissierellia bacterium]|nr:acyl carrier protein [Tissierellia bacterium]